MAEAKNSFIKSKMNKDLDARLIPNGEYREGINIQVSKSEGADVGALENVLGNQALVDLKTLSGCNCDLTTIGLYTDEVNNNIFIFLTDYDETKLEGYNLQSLNYSPNANNYIYVHNISSKITTELVKGAFLNFSITHPILSVNLLEGILFWTDNRNQPRRINIQNATTANYYTTEDQISVATYAPFQPIQLYRKRQGAYYVQTTDTQASNYNPNFAWNDNIVAIWANGGAAITDGITSAGATKIKIIADYREGLAREFSPTNTKVLVGARITALNPSTGAIIDAFDAPSGGTLYTALDGFDTNTNEATLIGSDLATPAPTILDIPDGSILCFNGNVVPNHTPNPKPQMATNSNPSWWVTSMEDASNPMNPGSSVNYDADKPGITENPNYNPKFNGDPDFLEDKFVRFSYRFKFEDGNYSVMAPFTQAAFIPKQDGYFLNNVSPSGMTSDEQATYRSTVVGFMENKVNNIYLQIPLPLDKNNNGIQASQLHSALKIEEIEILYKESDSLAVQVVDTIPQKTSTGYERFGTATTIEYNYQGSKPYKTLPESEIIRVYDKAPVRAHGQEIISNRLVYSNFQNKHTPPETLDYNVAVSDKLTSFSVHDDNPELPRPIERTVSREYPMHTVKQNRNYQVGIVLSDRYGRSSTTILSSVSKQATNADDLTLLGDTVYFPYNEIQNNTTNTGNNINDWPGDSIKVLFNSPINELIPHDIISGWPSLYNGDVTSADYNPLGWYSYKVVVKQTEQEYYNVYLPGIMNFYPAFATTGDSPDVAGSVSYITLLNDNINKVPRDLTEVGPEQKQFRSSVQLYGRVAPGIATQPLFNYQFNPVNTNTKIAISDTVSTISDQNDLLDNNTNIKFGSIYQTASNPLMGRVNLSDLANPIGSTEPALNTTDVNTWLSVYETSPVESRIDIYWETSSTGTISELNEAIKTGETAIKDFTTGTLPVGGGSGPETWTFNFAEDVTPGSSITASYSSGTYTSVPFFPYSLALNGDMIPVINSDININGGFYVKNSLQEDVTNKFVLTKNPGDGSTTPDSYNITVAPDTFFYYGPEGEGDDSIAKNTFTFTFVVINNDASGRETTITKQEKLLNVPPTIDCPSDGIIVEPGQTPVYTFTGVNGTTNNAKNTEDLRWSITSQDPVGNGIPELTITAEDGNGVVRDPCADGSCPQLNQPVSLTISLTDAGTTETTIAPGGGTGGNPVATCSPSVDGNTGYDTFPLNESFGSVKNQCINQASESSGFYWAVPTSNPVDSSLVPPVDRNPINAGTLDLGTSLPSYGSQAAANCSGWSWKNSNRNMNISMNESNSGLGSVVVEGRTDCQTTGPIASPEGITEGTTSQPGGSAYLIVDFELGNYGQAPNDRPSVIWPAYLQYRENSGSTWQDAKDVEGNTIKFGGAQANTYYRSDSDSAVTIGGGNVYSATSQPSAFYTTGVKDQLSAAVTQEGTSGDPAKTDSFESWMESRESTYDPELVSIGRKLFVIGRNQAYREPSGNAPTDAPDMYGEYRLVVRYPYGNNISPTTALSQSNPKIPTLGINNCPIDAYANYDNAEMYQRVYLSFGDFYNPTQLASSYYNGSGNNLVPPVSFAYRVSSIASDSRAAASGTFPDQVVYAREWGFKYVSKFYMDPELTTGWSPGATNKWFAYRGIATGDGSLNVEWGNEYASTRAGAPIWPDTNTGGSYIFGQNTSFRDMKWTAQFDQNGKKIIRTAEPCVAELDQATGGNANPCPAPSNAYKFGVMNVIRLGDNKMQFTQTLSALTMSSTCNLATLFYKLTNNAALDRNALIVGVAGLVIYSPNVGDCYNRIGSMSFSGGARVIYETVSLGGYSGTYIQMTITGATSAIDAFQSLSAQNYFINGTSPCS
jgi:hypothetical protein